MSIISFFFISQDHSVIFLEDLKREGFVRNSLYDLRVPCTDSYSSCPLHYSKFNFSLLLADAILVLLTRSDAHFVSRDGGGLT